MGISKIGSSKKKSSMSKQELAEAKEKGLLNIGEAAKAADVSAKRIRHYEKIGLIEPADRTYSNYRLYSSADVHTLRFINSARNLGFSIEKIRDLLSLWQNTSRSSEEVKRIAMQHVEELDSKIREMQMMSDSIRTLAEHCHGDHRPDCPILEGLANNPEGLGNCH